MSELSENLRNMRLMRGYSIKEVASNVGCAPNTIANYEKGTISPNVDMLQELCNFYKISPNQVFGWEHCPELEDFINEKKAIMEKLNNLHKQKADIDRQIRSLAKQLNQRQ